jgi:hypothetical protein
MSVKNFLMFIVVLSFFPAFSLSQEESFSFPEKPQGVESQPINVYLLWVYKVLIWLGMLFSVVGLAFAGLKFLTSLGDPSKLKDARDQAIKAILGLLLMFIFPATLGEINPQLSIANIFKPPGEIPSAPVKEIPPTDVPGVYALGEKNKIHIFSFSIPNLHEMVNEPLHDFWVVNGISPEGTRAYYGAVFFEEENFKGDCYEIPPPQGKSSEVINIKFNVGSIAVYSYKSSPLGKVTFYRYPMYNKKGGFLDVFPSLPPSWIYLKDLEFEGVPDREKKCLEWDENGNCIRWGVTLEGDEISSIEIDAPDKNLSVLMVAKKREVKEPKCQLFYSRGGKYDVANIKDEYIRADNGFPYAIKILPGKPLGEAP